MTILLIITTTLVSILTGIFIAFSLSINRSLDRLGDSEYIRAMQQINSTIQNPLFFIVFMGPIVLLPIMTILSRSSANPYLFNITLVASILYIAGTFGLTVIGNVPLNERLAKFSINNANPNELAITKDNYQKPWNKLHSIRTFTAFVASVLLVVACTL